MRFTTTLVATLLATVPTTFAHRYKGYKGRGCLNDKTVNELVDVYRTLVSSIDEAVAEKYLADDFSDWSNSIDAFFGKPYDIPTFATKADFIAAQLKTQQVPVTIDSVPVYDCDTVAMIWHADMPMLDQVARGITVMELTKGEENWQISRIDVEFNSLAWTAGIGGAYQVLAQQVGEFECPA